MSNHVSFVQITCSECGNKSILLFTNHSFPKYCPECSYRLKNDDSFISYFLKHTSLTFVLKSLTTPNFRYITIKNKKEVI